MATITIALETFSHGILVYFLKVTIQIIHVSIYLHVQLYIHTYMHQMNSSIQGLLSAYIVSI